MEPVDAYREWFELPADRIPPHHYDLLGIAEFENSRDTILAAAEKRMKLLKQFQTGPHAELSQQLLTEVAQAKIILANPEKKRAYDQVLCQNQEHLGQSRSRLDDSQDEHWLADLLDLRVIVFLVSIAVIAMTATVVFQQRQGDNNNASKENPVVVEGTVFNEADPDSTDAQDHLPGATDSAFTPISQRNDGSFVLPAKMAIVMGCRKSNDGLSDWQSGGTAEWPLNFNDRRTGFFYCEVTYRAKFESRFAAALGDRTPRKFTIYPHETMFTEEFIVRIAKPDQQSFQLIAIEVDPLANVVISQVKLVPR